MEKEIAFYSSHIERVLESEKSLACYFPLTVGNFFERLRDGVIIGYLLCRYFPESIEIARLIHGLDLSLINTNHSKVLFEVNGNLNYIVSTAKSIEALKIVNFGAEDILNCNKELVLGLLRQIYNCKLSHGLNVRALPQLIVLMKDGEDLASFCRLKGDSILIRWVNYHLENAHCHERINSLDGCLCDGIILAKLIHHLFPTILDENCLNLILSCSVQERVQKLAAVSDSLGCSDFFTVENILSGDSKASFACLASIFDKNVGIFLPSQSEFRMLQKEHAEMAEKVENLESALSMQRDEFFRQYNDLQYENTELKRQVQEYKDDLSRNDRNCELRIQTLKEELEVHYKETIDATIQREKSFYQEQIWGANDKLKSACRQLQGMSIVIREFIPTGANDIVVPINVSADCLDDIETCIKDVETLTKSLFSRIVELEKQVSGLESSMHHSNKVNSLIDCKIRELAMQANNDGKERKTRSFIGRLFSRKI